jgi:hypothetical protein
MMQALGYALLTRPCLQGAPESVLRRCTSVLANNGEGVVPMSDAMRDAILQDMQVGIAYSQGIANSWGTAYHGKRRW